jgi:hypothetical protein
MKIMIEPAVMARLLSYALATKNEYSGFGFCERREDGNIHVYDFALLDVGTWAYTEIDPMKLIALMQRPDRANMKVWIHRHPMGTGTPGPHNWSGTDEFTIRKEPLGATPEAVSWSVSIVLTPAGFVGRIDNYVTGKTKHLEVEPLTTDFFSELRSLEAALTKPKSSKPQREKSPSSKPKKVRLYGRKPKEKKSPKNGKAKSLISTIRTHIATLTATLKSLFSSASSAGNTTRLPTPSLTSAKTTE